MDVAVQDNPQEHRYEVREDGRLAGFVQYRRTGSRITMIHTEIDPRFEGRGLGSELARAALADIRAQGLELVPVCPFIAAYVRRHPDEYLDLVAAGSRERVMAGG